MRDDDNTTEISLGTFSIKGWPGVVAAVVIIVGGLILSLHQRQLPPEAAEAVIPYIQVDYSEPYRKELQELSAAGRPPSAELAQQLLDANDITITEIRGRGYGSEVLARVEFLVNGNPPPDGRSPRYYRLRYSRLTGWSFEAESTALSYRMQFL